jgi:cell division protein FtsW
MVINVGMVLAMLPVIGLPLPLVSYGGSGLVPSLIALGLLVSFARHEPGAQAALQARRRPSRLAPRLGRRRRPGTAGVTAGGRAGAR